MSDQHPFPFDIAADACNSLLGGVQWVFRFVNGYGASVVRHSGSYGSAQGLWELAVRDSNDRLTYDTPITDDVLGRLTEQDVASALSAIARLPKVVQP